MNKKLKTRGASLLQSLAGIRPWGKKKGGKRRKKKTIFIRPGKIAFDLLLCFLVITIVPVLIYSAVDPSTTALMWIRWSESDDKKDLPRAFTHWVKLENISPHLMKAVISSEDQKFFQHRGFDWQSIESAIVTNLTTDRTVGASTISMQTSRNVFLWQDRSWLRKSLETYFTVLIENLWSKKRILEVYLNVIEWGNGIYGCESASRAYFNHPSRLLSPVEAAWMAAVLPNPRRWSIHHPHPQLLDRQARILRQMTKIRLPRLT